MSSATAVSGIALTVLSLSSCSTDDATLSSRTGRLSVDVIADTSIKITGASRAGGPEYDPNNILANLSVSDLSLKLVNAEGSFTKTWDSFTDFSAEEEFPVGSYTLSAFYGSETEEGVEKPYLIGEAEVNVKGGSSTPVTLEASVANSITAVDFTDDFKDFFPVYSVSLTSVNKNIHRFSGAEHTPLYIGAGETRVTADVTLEDGRTGTLELSPFTARAATYHKITMDVNASKGTLIMTVTFEDNLEEFTTEIEVGDQLVDGSCPVVTPEGFEGNVAMPFVEGNLINNSYKFNIVARRGFKEVTLIRSSPRYGGGFQETYDLLREAARKDLAKEHGVEFLGLGEGEMFGKIDLSNWVKDLRRYDRSLDLEEITFTLRVVDQTGATTDIDLSDNNIFKVNLYKETMKVEPVEGSMNKETYQVRIVTNMNWIENRLVLSQKEGNDNDGWEIIDKVEYTVVDSYIDPTYATSNEFVLTLPTPKTLYAFEQHTLSVTGELSEDILQLVRPLPDLEFSFNQNDIFAKRGKFQIKPATSEIDLYNKIIEKYNGKITVDIVDDDGHEPVAYSEGDFQYSFRDLEYSQAKIGNVSQELPLNLKITGTLVSDISYEPSSVSGNITTEAPLQLYNGNMEEWYRVAGRTNYWWVDYPGNDENTVWGTMNQLTTSQGGNGTTITNRNGCAYSANSGTQPTSDAHSGSKAATIRTVGWGAGNSASANIFGSSFGTCENVNAGELYLGVIVNDISNPAYGIELGSRPSAISFWYKYNRINASNDDMGVALCRIEDEKGYPLYDKEVLFEQQNSYVQYKFEIDWEEIGVENKISKLILTFKSSNKSATELLSKTNSTYMTPPPAMNLSNGEYLGSQLYIDDIELIY